MRVSRVPTAAFLAVLFLAKPCPAADPVQVVAVPPPPPAKWAEVTGQVGQLVRLASDRPGRWVLVDDAGADLQPGPDGKAATFAASAPGRYKLLVIAGDAEPARVVVVVGGAPTPPNPKPPDPPLPPPPDPLRAKLKAAFDADPGTAAAKDAARKDLAELYRQAATLAADPSVTTTGELLDRIRRAGQLLAGDVLPGTRKTIGEELAAVFPVDVPLGVESRTKAAALFTAISNTLGW